MDGSSRGTAHVCVRGGTEEKRGYLMHHLISCTWMFRSGQSA